MPPSPSSALVATGITGLDAILKGGLADNAVYMLQGTAGTGKTILANQVCFHQAKAGRRVVYLTLLAESHDRLLNYLGALSFTDVSLVPDQIYYVSAYSALQDEGPSGILRLVRDFARRMDPDIIVFDGLYVAHEHIGSEPVFRKFLYELTGEAYLHECMMLLLTSNPDTSSSAGQTVVDGFIQLEDHIVAGPAYRTLTVHKVRGSDYLRGRHQFTITGDGIIVYPRLESIVDLPTEIAGGERLGTGVADLDRMMNGGVQVRSSTLVVGPPGAGKTSVGLRFLGEASVEQPGLLMGYYEPPDILRWKASRLGIDVGRMIAEGALRIVWQPPLERSMDELGHRLVAEVRASSAKRVFVDGAGALRLWGAFRERVEPFFNALALQLQAEGATTFISSEARGLFSPESSVLGELAPFADNVLMLRFIEHQSRLVRLASLVKMRASAFDPAIVPFEISEKGITFMPALERVEDMMRTPMTPADTARQSESPG